MIVKNPKFEISAVSKKQYPKGDKKEIVLSHLTTKKVY